MDEMLTLSASLARFLSESDDHFIGLVMFTRGKDGLGIMPAFVLPEDETQAGDVVNIMAALVNIEA